ncbi:hypothetical protein ACI2OX_09280 [Bacillus sp. N9]
MTWLFAGDLEKEGEEEMLRAYRELKADVLKVGHHGSRSSTTTQLLQRSCQPMQSFRLEKIIDTGIRMMKYFQP